MVVVFCFFILSLRITPFLVYIYQYNPFGSFVQSKKTGNGWERCIDPSAGSANTRIKWSGSAVALLLRFCLRAKTSCRCPLLLSLRQVNVYSITLLLHISSFHTKRTSCVFGLVGVRKQTTPCKELKTLIPS